MVGEEKVVMNFRPGQVTVTVNGVKGKACQAFSKPFEDVLFRGAASIQDKVTAEMNAPAVATEAATVQIKQA